MFQLIQSVEQKVIEEFTANSFSTSDAPNWSKQLVFTCAATTYDQCLSCPLNSSPANGNKCVCNAGFYAYQFQCLPSCPTGFIPDSTQQFCVVDFCAASDCQTCTNKLCTACVGTKKLLNGQCVNSCPSYAPLTSGVCKDYSSTLTKLNLFNHLFIIIYLNNQCVENCQNCDASGCLACASGFQLYQKQCYSQCPDGTYKLSASECAACHASCKTCSGGIQLFSIIQFLLQE
ncbi:hypothetical protein ABPG73_023044 [Tetrahymena malaccensis]